MARRINTSSGASSSIDRHVVSPSLLKSIDSEIQRPSRPEFILGLGEPFEPNPWDLDCPEDDDAMLQASQAAEEQLQSKLVSRASPPTQKERVW